MAWIEKRAAGYRDPLGRQQSRTFSHRSDAERFAREDEVDKDRRAWIDPRDSDLPLAGWSDTFLSLARRLAPTTQETLAPPRPTIRERRMPDAATAPGMVSFTC